MTHGVAGAWSGDTDSATGFDGLTGSANAPLDLSGTSATTVEFWLNWAVYANDGREAIEFSPDSDNTDAFTISPNGASGLFEANMHAVTGDLWTAATFTRPSANAWHHYAIEFTRGAPSTTLVYVDGAPVSLATNIQNTLSGPFANSSLYMMSRGGTTRFASGQLDELAIYPQALAAGRVQAHYSTATGSSVNPSPTATAVPPTATASPAATTTPPTATPTTAATPLPSSTQVVTPSQLLQSGTEIANSGRGEFRESVDGLPDPSAWPAPDGYQRYTWADIEPSQGAYNWSLIDNQLSQAQSRGGKFWFRVMAQVTSLNACPAWVPSSVDTGTWGAVQHCNWNDPTTINGIINFISNSAARYNTDPRFMWAEIGWYGDAGEWSNIAGTPMTLANQQSIIDAYARYWTTKRIVMMTDPIDATHYALSLSPTSGPIGLRVDCLGSSIMGGFTLKYATGEAIFDRWKTAPFATEYCGGLGTQGFVTGLQQVSDYHVSQAGAKGYGMTCDQNCQDAFKKMGYRYTLNSVTSPTSIQSGTAFNVTAHWANVGVAPTYAPWNVAWQLRNPSTGAIVWQANSHQDLRTLLPSADAPLTDTFTLPSGITPGTYSLTLVIVDPSAYSAPMALAIQGRQADGSYQLGSVTVR